MVEAVPVTMPRRNLVAVGAAGAAVSRNGVDGYDDSPTGGQLHRPPPTARSHQVLYFRPPLGPSTDTVLRKYRSHRQYHLWPGPLERNCPSRRLSLFIVHFLAGNFFFHSMTSETRYFIHAFIRPPLMPFCSRIQGSLFHDFPQLSFALCHLAIVQRFFLLLSFLSSFNESACRIIELNSVHSFNPHRSNHILHYTSSFNNPVPLSLRYVTTCCCCMALYLSVALSVYML